MNEQHQVDLGGRSVIHPITPSTAQPLSAAQPLATAQAIAPADALERTVFQSFEITAASRRRILVFDEDDETSAVMSAGLAASEYELVRCLTRDDVGSYILIGAGDSVERFDLLLWGLSHPFDEGLRALRDVRVLDPRLKVALLAPQEALAYASDIKEAGVETIILKPLHVSDVRSGVERAFRRSRLSEAPRPGSVLSEVDLGHRVPGYEDGRDLGLIGSSPEMRKVVALIRKVGPSSVSVLITGESGTGKEMVAKAIHRVSDRNKKPFIAINCAAIPRDLLESELFGHARGAFTGATTARRGLFEEAHEGTILLDEIGDLPLPLQAKILRLLQTKQVKPLGQNGVREVDVRIISATHKSLKALIQRGEFREDLYYRLNVMPIHLPALRDRRDDILFLVEHFLKRYHDEGRGPLSSLTRKAVTKLMSLPWKGNVRELENVIERAIVLAEGDLITENEILTEEMEPVRLTAEDLFNAGMTMKDIEREYIKYVLSRTGNRKEAATRILGIDRKTLYRKEKLYGIRPPSDLN